MAEAHAGSVVERSADKPPANAPALEAAKAKSPERGIQSPVSEGPGEAASGAAKVVEERREDGLQAAHAERTDESRVGDPDIIASHELPEKAKNPADKGPRVDSHLKKLPSEEPEVAYTPKTTDEAAGGKNAEGAAKGKPVEEDPTKVPEPESPELGSGGKSAKAPVESTEDPADESDPPVAGTSSPWSLKILKAGKAIEECSRYVGSWHAPLQHSSDFLRQVGRYAPATGLQQGCPAALIWVSWACDKVSALLAEAATTVQGASALGRMVGRCTSVIGNKFKAEPGEEPEPDEEDVTAKVLITSCDQLEEVLKFWEAGARVQLDIGPDVSAALANHLYEMLRQRGPATLELIRKGPNMRAKRSGA